MPLIISVTTSSSLLRILAISSATHFLMTGRCTLVMSTRLLNSGGYLVVRIARASAPVWSAADMLIGADAENVFVSAEERK